MEELGRGFFVFCGFLVFWMLFDPCLRNMLFCDEFGRFFEFEWMKFIFENVGRCLREFGTLLE